MYHGLRLAALLGLLLPLRLLAGDPYFVDLRAAANTAREDDGIANNEAGGWTDEGINDAYVWPAIPTGPVTRNGYQFSLIAPADNDGRAVIMLRGKARAQRKPAAVTLTFPAHTAKYLYFLQHAAAAPSPAPASNVVATYTVTYADGSHADLVMHDGVELRQWWSKNWWDNSGGAAWPVFMGVNLYSAKYNFHIGLWATQCANPHPELPLTGITLTSAGQAVPIIWAITLADEDFYEPETRRKEHFERLPAVPDGYFAEKLAAEHRGIFQAATKDGLLRGLRQVELLRPDLLAVTVDGALGEIGAGPGSELAAKYQVPATFAISSLTDTAYTKAAAPLKVGRHSEESWNGDIGTFPVNTLYTHTYYLTLPTALQAGQTYTVTVAALPLTAQREFVFTYAPALTETPALKVNQVAYSSRSPHRYAYLGWWAGDQGAVDYAAYQAFSVVDERSGKAVLTGAITARAAADALSGEQVGQLDLSTLPVGRYHVVVPGLARSASFTVGDDLQALYYHTMRAFYHQRCGAELGPPFTTFARPADALLTYEHGYLVGNPAYVPAPNEPVREFRGGYHDAGDDDCFAVHLRATAQVLDVVSFFPERFHDGDLNLPESGNGLPDVLDEAAWGLGFYAEQQAADGGILAGRGNDQDAIREWTSKHHGTRPSYGNFPATASSSAEFAAVAAIYARALATARPAAAAPWLAKARLAYAWAVAHPTAPAPEKGETLLLGWAAAELYRTTGEAALLADMQTQDTAGHYTKYDWQLADLGPLVWWAIAACEQPGMDAKLRDTYRQKILQSADGRCKATELPAYRMGAGLGGGGWGSLAGGGRQAFVCLLAWRLTQDAKYLDAISLNADYQLGCNPLSRTFITGLGARHPNCPELNPLLYTGPHRTGTTVPGITIYGPAAAKPEPQKLPGWFPELTPPWRAYRDLGNGGAEMYSEFTVTEELGTSAALYCFLYALEQGPLPVTK